MLSRGDGLKSKKATKKIFLVLLVMMSFLLLGINTAFSKSVSKVNFSRVIISSPDLSFYAVSIAHEVIFKSGWSIEAESGILLIPEEGNAVVMLAPKLTIKKYIKSTLPFEFWFGGGVGIIWGGVSYSASVGSKWLLGKAFTIEPFFRLNYYALMLPLETLPHGFGFSLGLGLGIR